MAKPERHSVSQAYQRAAKFTIPPAGDQQANAGFRSAGDQQAHAGFR
jgi:hypothetical protein